MDIFWLIRSGILFVAGFMLLLYPERAYNFSRYLAAKLHLNINIERDRKYYRLWGIIFIFISLILFVYSII